MKKTRPLDIFQVLGKLDKKEINFYDSLSDTEQKSVAPVVIMRWLSGINNRQQIIILNEYANPYVFTLFHHKKLLWLLLTVCTTGNIKRYKWNKVVTSSNNSTPECIKCIKQYYNYNTKDAKIVFNTIQPLIIIEMAEEMGYSDTDINNIKRELGLPAPKRKTSKRTKKTDSDSINIGFEF